MAMFWWEDGYDPLNPPKQQTRIRNTIKFDGDGDTFLLTKLETAGVHRLCVSFLPGDSSAVITLNNTGRKFFSVNYYKLETVALSRAASTSPGPSNSSVAVGAAVSVGSSTSSSWQLGEVRSVPVVSNTGYFAVSRDGNIMSTAILKCDKMKILDVRNDDLLVNVDGGCKMGYWGQLKFLPAVGEADYNSSLLELRVLKMDRSNPTESVLRLWDLGFRNPVGTDPSEEVDDEEENILWTVKFAAGICSYAAASDFIIVSLTKSEKLTVIQWLDRSSGNKTKEIRVNEWCSKPVMSKNERFCAFAHIGRCVVRDAVSGDVMNDITVPGLSVPFPIVPIAFINADRFVAMRVDLDMMFILCEWEPSNKLCRLVINKLGGTISSDSVCISSDEKYLACWPYGCIELFDLKRMSRKLTVRADDRRMALAVSLTSARLGRSVADMSDLVGRCCEMLLKLDERLYRFIVSFI
jgi:hypothetical protein